MVRKRLLLEGGEFMWLTPAVKVVDFSEFVALSLSNLSVACDRIKCCG